jgi:anhydro-N-acetylmuramic acid kinase
MGETFAAVARRVADQASFSLLKVFCLGLREAPIWEEVEGRYPSILTTGMAAPVAEQTGLTTVGEFSARDMAAGGLGMPLSTMTDYLLLRRPDEERLVVHLGKMAQVTLIPANARVRELVAFEAGPCNMLLDGLIRELTGNRETFDSGGRHGVQGKCHEALLNRWLEHTYFARRPPKSVPRSEFGTQFIRQALMLAQSQSIGLHDVLCTASHFVVRSIADSIERFLPSPACRRSVLLTGGGSRNGLLLHLFQQALKDAPILKAAENGLPGEAQRPVGAALLALLTMDGVAGNVPAATAASGGRLLGSITPGSTANWARCVAWLAGQSGAGLAAAA